MTGKGRVRKGVRIAQAHAEVARQVEATGLVPPIGQVAETLGIARAIVSRAYRTLVAAGAMSEPHGKGGGYRLDRLPSGEEVVLRLEVVSDG